MEEDQDLKFVCKLCNKKYPCGKSLGGHMRSHVLTNSTEFDEKLEANKLKKVGSWTSSGKNQSKFELCGISGYGLRENPKKSWRIEDSKDFPLPHEKVCQQCGKVFQSLKALCGHMSCHSEKDKDDENSWTSDSHSDTEADELISEKCRSMIKRYKKIVAKPLNNYNCSSSVSEIDQDQEPEEVAKCLMMLSKDSWIWNTGVNSFVETSDNSSVVLETKSSSTDMRNNATKNVLKQRVYNQDEKPRTMKERDRNLKLDMLEAETESENSDSDYFLGENGKLESDGSVEGFGGNGNCKWSTSKMSLGAWFDEKKGINRIRRCLTESRKDLSKKFECDDYGLASNSDICESRKGTTDRYNDSKKIKLGLKGCKNDIHKKRKYECMNCKKTFSSFQALGGHRPCHKKINDYTESTYETGENSICVDHNDPKCINIGKHRDGFRNKNPAVSAQDQPYEPANKVKKTKKSKGHKCPFCHRMFKSGQALGGHKRSHFIHGGDQENLNQQSSAVKHEVADLLDLNLPAPVDDEDDDHARFMSW